MVARQRGSLSRREQLKQAKRTEFFVQADISLASQHQASVTVVVVDASKGMARSQSKSHEEDVTALFLERCDWACGERCGLPIIAKPSGGPVDEKKFVAGCLALIQAGTEYMNLKNFALGVLTAPSKQVRLLQLADVVTSCTVARVSGETQYSPPVLKAIRPLFRGRDGSRTGGVGLKIHPDYNYVNLYHWLLGDTFFFKGNVGHPLPIKGRPYFDGPGRSDGDVMNRPTGE